MFIPVLTESNIEDHLAPKVREVEESVKESISSGTAVSEERITGILSDEIRKKISISEIESGGGLEIKTGAFEARNEPESGADLGLRYQFTNGNILLSKGVIVQSKRYGKSDIHLSEQCYKMLARSQESYIFTYSPKKIGVIPALTVYADRGVGGKFTKYYDSCFTDFFLRLLKGFHGDVRISDRIDEPAEIALLPQNVRYLVDIQVSAGDAIEEEISFNRVSHDQFRSISQSDFY